VNVEEVLTVDDTVSAALLAADAIADKKGADVVVLDVGDLIAIAGVFVIGTGSSRPHVQTLVERVEEKLTEVGRKPLREEGRSEAEWVLLDYGDVIVHIFQPASRDFFGLERLWRDAPVIAWEPAVSEAP
jgi:ribosome-associated protein